jgi:hypothetical protein
VRREWLSPASAPEAAEDRTVTSAMGVPMIQRWINESMRGEPFNNLGEVCARICNNEAGAVGVETAQARTAWSCQGTAGSECSVPLGEKKGTMEGDQ